MARKANQWANDHERCRHCGTTDRRHRAKGLCGRCYNETLNQKHKRPDAYRGCRRGGLTRTVSEQTLRELYIDQQMSLQEIADRFGCTRVMILYLMKRHRVPRRSHSEARRLAQRDGKVKYTRRLTSGEVIVVKPRCTTINEYFFRGWSPEMAYVLGVFYSDGCLFKSPAGYYSATISQKEPELLEKCLALMDCDAPLQFKRNNSPAGGLYAFTVNDQGTCRNLIALGVHPRKSLTLQFPNAPFGVLRHFIRGCWDGDGSICKTGRTRGCWNASYVSGSEQFIRGMRDCLVAHGMPRARITGRRDNRGLSFRYYGARCAKLFQILYDGVPATQYLRRKYDRFSRAATDWAAERCPPA